LRRPSLPFLLSIRRPPSPPLFPYTTLFKALQPVPTPDSASLLANKSAIAERTQGGMAGLFWWHAVFPLLFFFQFKVRLQFPLHVGVPFPDLPPSHLSSPQPRATLRVRQL